MAKSEAEHWQDIQKQRDALGIKLREEKKDREDNTEDVWKDHRMESELTDERRLEHLKVFGEWFDNHLQQTRSRLGLPDLPKPKTIFTRWRRRK